MSWLFPKAQKEHELFRDVHSNIDGNYYSIYENTGDAISKLKDAATELSGIIERTTAQMMRQTTLSIITSEQK